MNSIVTDKMWKLLELALEDLKKVEKDERYVVDMMSWHTPGDNGQCYVCLAGARLVGAGFPRDERVDFGRLDAQTAKMLYTLNNLRLGDLHYAHREFYGTSHPLLENGRAWVRYGEESWWPWMEGILQTLKGMDV